MSKYMDKLYKGASWIILGSLLLIYFAYMVLKPQGSIGQIINSWNSWLHIGIVIVLNLTMIDSAHDTATSVGIQSEEFMMADKLNNKIITSVNNEMLHFRLYAKRLNEHELQSIRDDFIFSIGDKKIEDFTPKELDAFNKLKPVQHNIYGFNLPLYYEATKSGKVNYQASLKRNQGKNKKKLLKSINSLLFAAATINVAFSVDNVGDALVSLLVIGLGLLVTFVMIYFPQVFKFKYEMPSKVVLKKTFYDGYVQFKNGTHVLRELEIKEVTVNVLETKPEAIPAEESSISNNSGSDASKHDHPNPDPDPV